MSSLKMTFSLTSLIFLIALGLVFGTVPVIADNGGTTIPAGQTTAQHDADGHADQTAADAAENANDAHMHPVITLTAMDSDGVTADTQVIPTAEADTVTDATAAEHLTLEFPITITVPKNAYSGTSGTTAIDATTFGAGTLTGEAFIGNAGTGGVAVAAAEAVDDKPQEFTAIVTVTLNDDGETATTNKAQREAALAAGNIEVTITVPHNIIYSSDARGPYMGQRNIESELTLTLIDTAVDAPPEDAEPAIFTVEGMISFTAEFVVTFTTDAADAALAETDIMVEGAEVTRLTKNPNPPDGKTVYWARILPHPGTEMVSVTIMDDATTAPQAAAEMGKLTLSKPKGTLNSITAADGANDTAPFLVTLTFAAALPAGTNVLMGGEDEDSDLMVTPATAKIGRPGVDPVDDTKWNVLITPTKGMDTVIGLSDEGKLRFTYAGDPLTVKAAATAGDVTVKYDAAKMTVELTGVIPANPFVSIPRLNDDDSVNYPDLQRFFDIGGTIDLHDADTTDGDDKNSREVVISEILWGYDRGAAGINRETQYQFIELYNTTGAALDVTGWTLVFSEGRPADAKIDVDQVSNRPPFGLGFRFRYG